MMQKTGRISKIVNELFSGVIQGINLVIEGVHGWTAGALMFCYFFADRVIRYSLLAHYADSNLFNSTALKIESYDFEMVKRYCMLYCLCFLIYHVYHRKKPVINIAVILQYAFYRVVIYSTEINYGSQWTENVFRNFSVKEVFLTAVFFLAVGSNLSSKNMKKVMRFCCWTYIIVLTYTNLVSLKMFYESGASGLKDLFATYSFIEIVTRNAPDIISYRFGGFYGNPTSLGLREYVTILCAGWLLQDKKTKHFLLKIICIMTILVSGYLLLLSQSRTALLNLAIIIFFAIMLLLQKTIKLKSSICYLTGVAMLTVIISFFIKDHLSFFHSLFDTDLTAPNLALDKITSGRTPVLRMAISFYQKNKQFGVGWYSPFGKLESAHNYLLNIIAWTGNSGLFLSSIVSLICLVYLIQNHKRVHHNQWMICMLCCIWISSILDQGILGSTNNPPSYFFYLILGYLIEHHRISGYPQGTNQLLFRITRRRLTGHDH